MRRPVFRVAATFVGTVVGAGFASGQEVMQFFAFFGGNGFWGILMATFLFCFFGVIVLELGRSLSASSYREILDHSCGRTLGWAMDVVVTLFLLGGLSVMLAGAGAVFAGQLGLPYALGTVSTAVLTFLTILYGMRGIMEANSLIVPVLVAVVVTLTAGALLVGGPGTSDVPPNPSRPGAGLNWLVAAWIYVAYNLLLSLGVLAPMGREIGNRQALILGGIAGGLVLGLLLLVINLALLVQFPEAKSAEVPMLLIARQYPVWMQLIFSGILWGEIYTTAIASAYGFAQRVAGDSKWSYPLVAAATVALAWVASRFGFSVLVGTLYPLFGYASMVFLGALLLVSLRGRIRL